jgi:multiple sugar transport system ATP-binding protein
LSGGQQQRVALGRCIVRNPEVFLFDEPLSNLDAKLRAQMRIEIKRLHAAIPTTSVFVTHDQVEAMTLGDRIAVMSGGRVEQFGTPEDIYARPATKFVAEFIGSPAMNMIPAVRSGTGIAANGVDLPMSAAQREALPANATAKRTYGLRPEALQLSADGIPGTMHFTEPTGPETYATVDTAVGMLTLRVPGYMTSKVGDAVHVKWAADATHLFDGETDKRIG